MEKMNIIKDNLMKKGYDVEIFESEDDILSYLNQQINDTTVGIGGSQTVSQLGIYEELSKHNTVYWHARMPENLTVMEVRKLACNADVYLSSVNAISMKGEIVNIDGTGNRVAATTFGPNDVYFIIGTNKIADTLEDAIDRARNVASPLNAMRLNRKTPCAVKGDRCYDCQSPERICRSMNIFLEKPTGCKYHILFVLKDLGY